MQIYNELDISVNAFIEYKNTDSTFGRVQAGQNDQGKPISNIEPKKSLMVMHPIKSFDEVRLCIVIDGMPSDNEIEGIKLIPGTRLKQPPHHFEIKKDNSKYEAIIHFDFSKISKKERKDMFTDLDPHVEHPKSFP